MPKLIKIKTTQADDEMNITWAPTNLCNFKCRYCWPEANTGTHLPIKNVELVTQNLNHILNIYTARLNKKKFKINFAGGEPTLWNGLETVIAELNKNHKIYWGIVTNGSRTLRWWREFGHLFDSVQISHHIAEADLQHTIDVADILYEQDVKITVRIMMDAANWDKGIEQLEYMKKNSKHRWIIDVAEVLENHLAEQSVQFYKDGRVYNPEQREFLKTQNKRIPSASWIVKNIKLFFDGTIRLVESVAYYDDNSKDKATANYYMNRKLNYFEGWKCNIASERFYIGFDGSVQGSCGQQIYDKPYNIFDENFIENFDPVIGPVTCQIKNCNCGPEMHVTKSLV